MASVEAARLGGYDYSPPRPQSLYETPSRPAPKPVKPPQTFYQTPSKPTRPPRPFRPPKTSYKPPSTPAPHKPKPIRKPQSEYHAPSSKVTAQQKYPGMPYSFQWSVDDRDSGNSFNHVESSDGQTTQGQYEVLLPDGRLQIVKFYDDGWGFVADVTYQ